MITPPLTTLSRTCATIEGQFCGGVEFLNEELREGDLVICLQRVIPFLPVEHQVIISVRIYTNGRIMQRE